MWNSYKDKKYPLVSFCCYTEPDEFGHTEEELAKLDQADFDWKLVMEDQING